MNAISLLWRRTSKVVHDLILRYGTRQFMIVVLAGIALVDAFVPVSANIFIIILAILQPTRNKQTVLLFASSAGISAFAFALVINTFDGVVQGLGFDTLGPQWQQARSMIGQYGPGILMVLAIFPDIPRASILVISLSDVAPLWIGLMVFVGKLILYSVLVVLIYYLPKRFGKRRSDSGKAYFDVRRRLRRFQAYRRRLHYLVKANETNL